MSDRLLTPLPAHAHTNEMIETGPITPLHSSSQPGWIKMTDAWTLRDAHNLNKTFDYIALWLKKTRWYIELHPLLADLNIEILLPWIIGQGLMRAEGLFAMEDKHRIESISYDVHIPPPHPGPSTCGLSTRENKLCLAAGKARI